MTISIWHLCWIVPISVVFGFFCAALAAAGESNSTPPQNVVDYDKEDE